MHCTEKAWRSLRYRMPLLVGIAVLAFLAYRVAQLWGELSQDIWGGNYPLLGLSLLMLVFHCALLAFAWQLILRVLGVSLGWLTGATVYFYCNFMRYLPGTFWYIPSRVHLSRIRGVVAERSSLSLVLELYLAVLSALLVGAGILATAFGGLSVLLVASLAALLLLGLRPAILLGLVNTILRRIGRAEIIFDLGCRQMLLILLPYLASWILYGVSFWMLLSFLRVPDLPSVWATTSICALSWAAGFLALPIPQGIGVHDAVLAFLLSNYMAVATAGVAALLWRLSVLLADAASTGLAGGLSQLLRRA